MEVEETAIGSDPNKSIHQHIDRSISEESTVGRLADWPISRSLVFVFAFAGAQTRSSPAASFAKAPSELSWYRLAKKIHPYIHPYIHPWRASALAARPPRSQWPRASSSICGGSGASDEEVAASASSRLQLEN